MYGLDIIQKRILHCSLIKLLLPVLTRWDDIAVVPEMHS